MPGQKFFPFFPSSPVSAQSNSYYTISTARIVLLTKTFVICELHLCNHVHSMYYTITTPSCHVPHTTAYNGYDDNICSILEYNIHGPTTYMTKGFVKGTMSFLLCVLLGVEYHSCMYTITLDQLCRKGYP